VLKLYRMHISYIFQIKQALILQSSSYRVDGLLFYIIIDMLYIFETRFSILIDRVSFCNPFVIFCKLNKSNVLIVSHTGFLFRIKNSTYYTRAALINNLIFVCYKRFYYICKCEYSKCNIYGIVCFFLSYARTH
jgi:hypothetical protein